MKKIHCTFDDCPLGIVEKKEKGEVLTKYEIDHIARSHSRKSVQLKNKRLGVGVVFNRCKSKNMAFYCQCSRRYWSRDSLIQYYKKKCTLDTISGLDREGLEVLKGDDIIKSVIDPDYELEEDPSPDPLSAVELWAPSTTSSQLDVVRYAQIANATLITELGNVKAQLRAVRNEVISVVRTESEATKTQLLLALRTEIAAMGSGAPQQPPNSVKSNHPEDPNQPEPVAPRQSVGPKQPRAPVKLPPVQRNPYRTPTTAKEWVEQEWILKE